MAERQEAPPPREGIGPMIRCACGCGATFRQFDADGRERQYKHGHYMEMLRRLLIESRGKRP
jgi:hypothetical protein